MKKLQAIPIALLLLASTLHAGKGKIRVASDQQGAYVYVDGKKKAMTGEGFTSILLEEGEHTVKVAKEFKGIGEVSSSKKIFVGEETSTKLKINLNSKLANKEKEKKKYEKSHRWQKQGTVVVDTKLGLMWQDNTAAKRSKKKWKQAKRYCKNLSLRGHDDWRLPSYDELLTIVDYDKYDPAIMPSFKNVASDLYWSSSPDISDISGKWGIDFGHGSSSPYYKNTNKYIRCVRYK